AAARRRRRGALTVPNHDLRVGAIIQARMSSQRLPGKSLRSIAGRPVLQYVVERLQHCDRIEAMVVATSTDVADDPIHAFCRFHGIDCIRGWDRRSEEHTSELQSHLNLVCRLLLEKTKHHDQRS